MPSSPSYHMYPCGDHAVTIELGNSVDAAANRRVIAFFNHLQQQKITGVKDLIPSYHTLTVVYDTILLKQKSGSTTVYEWLCTVLSKNIDAFTFDALPTVREIRIPVCYDLLLAPDLASLAAQHDLQIDEVIHLHSSRLYRVFMIGFLPGFAYMGSVDEKIITPRKLTPRTAVAAGSVGIAGEQTGIYPFESPGGWQLIGQTPLKVFDPSKKDSCLFQSGDEVQFYPITFSEFQKIKIHGTAHQ